MCKLNQNFAPDPARRVTGTPTSCSGSVITTLTWNPLDQLTAVSKTGVPSETYQYDPQGRRISKTVGAVTTHYRYSGDDIDAEYTASWTETARYVHGAGVDDPLMRLTGATASPDAQTRYYHQNGINSVVALSGNSQTRINVVTEAGASFTEGAGGSYTVGGVSSSANSLKDGNRSAASGHWTVTSGRTLDINFAGAREIEEVVLIGNPGLTSNPQPTETDLYGAASQFDNSTYTVQSWNGSAWVTQATVSANTNVIRRFSFAPVSTSKLRIIAVDDASNGQTVNDNVVSLAEVEVYTTPAGGTNQLQRFDAWGNQTQSAGAAIPQYGYTGREPDATGLIYYRARYYDPSIGRFISRDPAGMPDGVNRYAYVGNSPVNFIDPSGLVRWGDAFISGVNLVSNGAGVFVGAVITAGGAGLLAAPEPVLTKLAGVGAIAVGGTVYGKSIAGTAMNFNNLIDAIQDRPVSQPGSAAEWVAGKIAPGNVTVQKTAQILDLGLDLASGRVNPTKMIVLKPGEGIPRTKWGTAAETIERNYGGAGKAFNKASDLFQGGAVAGSLYDSGKDIANSLNLNNYFGNLQGTGGSGNQTLFGVSPRN